MKKLLNIRFVVSKTDLSEITAEEYEKFEDEFIELVEKYDMSAGGGIAHVSEEENEELEKYENKILNK